MFKLTDLSYSYDALLPYIDAQTMELHYEKHHYGYLNKLNKALEKSAKTPTTDIQKLLINVNHYNDVNVRNNAGGYYNHTLFWESMSPKPAKKPSHPLQQAINNQFGSLHQFIDHFSAKAASLFGAGWTWLCLDQNRQLHIVNTSNQDNPLMYYKKTQMTPLLGLDMWEHAYYLKYKNRRAEYILAFWQVLNWEAVSQRYDTCVQNAV